MASGSETAFVTGGSGFIGGRLIRRLVADGVAVRALARSESSAAKVEALGARAVRGDLDDVDAMASGAEGCNLAFHLAAHVAEWGPLEEFERGNVGGTRNAVEASRRAGVAKFVHCGTEAAILAGQALHGADETEPLRPDSPAPYSATKARAEALVREASGDGLGTVVVRPRFVWGAGDTTLLPEIAAAVESGKFAWVAGGEHQTSITHVDNVVEGLVLAAGRGPEARPTSSPTASRWCSASSSPNCWQPRGRPPDRTVPAWVAGALARGGEAAWKLLPLKGSPPLTRFACGPRQSTACSTTRRLAPSWATSRSSRASRGSPRCGRAQPDSSQTTIVPSTSTASMVIKRPAAPASDSLDAQSAETPSRKPASRTPIATAPHARSERSQRRSLSSIDGRMRRSIANGVANSAARRPAAKTTIHTFTESLVR